MNPVPAISLGDELYAAPIACHVVEPLSNRHPEITIVDA
jgi:hypothetical protein